MATKGAENEIPVPHTLKLGLFLSETEIPNATFKP